MIEMIRKLIVTQLDRSWVEIYVLLFLILVFVFVCVLMADFLLYLNIYVSRIS